MNINVKNVRYISVDMVFTNGVSFGDWQPEREREAEGSDVLVPDMFRGFQCLVSIKYGIMVGTSTVCGLYVLILTSKRDLIEIDPY